VFPFVILLFKKRRDKLCGNWNAYICWIDDGKITYDHMIATIKKGMVHEYEISGKNEFLHYKGKGYIEHGYLCVDLKDCGDSPVGDTTHNRYNLSQLDAKNLCYGLWLSMGSENNLSCGGVIISKKEMNIDQIREIIEKKYEIKYVIDNKFPFISLK
jgi:hypothetical protein